MSSCVCHCVYLCSIRLKPTLRPHVIVSDALINVQAIEYNNDEWTKRDSDVIERAPHSHCKVILEMN